MTDPDSTTNPQVQRTHRMMLDAARELLNEKGPSAVTHLRVAEMSGVARATVYRHWPDRADILLDLLREGADLHLPPPPEGFPLADRVTVLLRKLAASLNGDNGRILTAMIGLAEWDEDVFAALERMRAFGPTMLRGILVTGLDDGSLVTGTDITLLMDVLIGPLFLQRLLHHAEITDGYVDRLVATTLGPYLSQ